ncbi:MAG TPA: hypothetical protein VN038_12720 [Dyadobacter sp.]|nr:hypothetical protein [Dyadobacter sp.]
MNSQHPPSSVERSMLHAVWQRAGLFSEADFDPRINSGSDALMLQSLGIRFRTAHSEVPELSTSAEPVSRWRDISVGTNLDQLRGLIGNMRVIPFADWSDVHHAADIWYGLLADIIRPLARNDWEFIFYIGNPVNRHFFDLDEALDVIGSFSRTGNVTLALDELEAHSLWALLFGGKPVSEFGLQHPDAYARYRSIFQTMDVTRLIIYSDSQALLLMEGSHNAVIRPPVSAYTHNAGERANFIEGYALGLASGMDPAQSLALGIATAGAVPEGSQNAAKADVLRFLAEWLDAH